MPRARTGSLAYKRTTGWNARVWVPVTSGDGTAPEVRRWVPLETHDEDLAKRKMTKIVALIATGEYSVDEMKHTALRGQTCREEMVAFIASRRAAGVGMADDEEQRLTDYAMHRIGDMLVTHVRMRDINAILFAAKSSLSHETLRKLRGALDRMFEGLCKAEVIKENPVDRSEIPEGARVDERPRTILTDAEIITFLEGRASGPNGKRPRRDAERRLHELKVMAVCSRVLGGLRTAEVNRWSWDMVVDPDAKLQTYARVNVRRAKAKRGHQGKVQTFSVPAPMRPILAAWHELHGRPLDGPVFPVTKGRRKGEERSKRGTSYANRLRRELLRMGITRQAIHKDLPTSRRVDFHSFRRAFSTALAEAGVNAGFGPL